MNAGTVQNMPWCDHNALAVKANLISMICNLLKLQLITYTVQSDSLIVCTGTKSLITVIQQTGEITENEHED